MLGKFLKEKGVKAFDELLEVARVLNGPGGCPWDLKQTFFSLQPYVLEEAHEVVEAVDGQNDKEIVEELGDLLYTVIFYAKVAEKEKRFTMEDILLTVKEKLIRRHPHVFGSTSAPTEEEVKKNWDLIKNAEEGKKDRKSPLEGIPDGLPLLAKAQKMVNVFAKAQFHSPALSQDLAEALWEIVEKAESSSIDIESAFRRKLSEKKQSFLAK